MLFKKQIIQTIFLADSLIFGSSNFQQATLYPTVFYIPDTLLLAGVLFLIWNLSTYYKQLTHRQLLVIQLRYFKNWMYVTLSSLILTIKPALTIAIPNFEKLYTYYQFSLLTQVTKIIIVLILLMLIQFLLTFEKESCIIETPLLLQVLGTLSFIAISSNNMPLLLLSLEVFSLVLYTLTAAGYSYGGVIAAAKYFSFGTLGSVFLFWGMAHFYTITPNLSINAIYLLISTNQNMNVATVVDFSSNLLLIGLLIKLGAAPYHQWVADTYAGANLVTTSLFATLVKFVIFILFIKIAYFIQVSAVIDVAVVCSLCIGCWYALKQSELKRLVAYSSIVHVGFLLMGDISSSLVYIVTYVLSNLLLFSVLINVRIAGKELLYLNDLKYVRQAGQYNPHLIAVAVVSSAGLPPFAGFYGKYLTWISLFEDIYLYNDVVSYIILAVSIGISLITVFYYIRVLVYLYIQNDKQIKPLFQNQRFLNSTLEFYQLFIAFLLIGWSFIHSKVLLITNLIISTSL